MTKCVNCPLDKDELEVLIAHHKKTAARLAKKSSQPITADGMAALYSSARHEMRASELESTLKQLTEWMESVDG